MESSELKTAYTAAAAVAAGITGTIFVYTVVVEALRAKGYAAPLHPPAAYALKYGLYIVGLTALPALKLAAAALGGAKPTRQEALRALATLAIVRAAVCEVPAIAGLLLFLLTGCRADFYALAVFSLVLEIYNFPRLQAWEEKLRGDFGQL
jgi:hypothetical protein